MPKRFIATTFSHESKDRCEEKRHELIKTFEITGTAKTHSLAVTKRDGIWHVEVWKRDEGQ